MESNSEQLKDKNTLDIYSLSRNFWDFSYENPDKISPNHAAIYFFCVEHCNRLGWKERFAVPTSMVMEATGIKNWRTYSLAFNDLVSFGLIKLIEKSKNQWSANVIAIVKNTKAKSIANTVAPTKALDEALQKHSQKHYKSTVDIDIQYNNTTNLQSYNTTIAENFKNEIISNIKKYLSKDGAAWKLQIWQITQMIEDFDLYIVGSKKIHINISEYLKHFSNWGNTRFLSYQKIENPDNGIIELNKELSESTKRYNERMQLIKNLELEQNGTKEEN